MQLTETVVELELFHKNYNLDRTGNLDRVPEQEAVFALFAVVNERPANCRYAGSAMNLGKAVQALFEEPQSAGMKQFMQGPWIKMLLYSLMPGSSEDARKAKAEEWTKQYAPKIDDQGEYPGYYGPE
jgi:hypothetical protein